MSDLSGRGLSVYNPTDASALFTKNWTYPVHTLKTIPPYWSHVARGQKTFEIRRDDRGFQPGDLLLLAEWDGAWTGRDCVREITYVMRDAAEFGVTQGFVVLGMVAPSWASPSRERLSAPARVRSSEATS